MDQLFERLMPGAARLSSIVGRNGAPLQDDGPGDLPLPASSESSSTSPGTGAAATGASATAHAGATAGAMSRIAALSDADLATAIAWTASLTRDVQAIGALLAAEVARRSRPELGYTGLAQSSGHRTPEAMIQAITKAPYIEAARSVKVGEMMAVADASLDRATPGHDAARRPEGGQLPLGDAGATGDSPLPWSEPVSTAVRDGILSIASADSIMRGLGQPTGQISPDTLHDAAVLLVHEGCVLGSDQLFRRARQVRDALDRAGVADRERQRYEQRFLRIGPEIDGMRRITGLLDPESAAIVGSAIDAVTSPRRGGPRFVDPAERVRAEAIIADPRTTEQLALDALVQMIRIAAEADPNTVFGKHRPAVRMLVTADDLRSDAGCGRIEGAPDAVSLSTIRRGICDGGIVPVLLDASGQALDVGQDQRLFTSRQRTALAVRDGGCMIPDCDRPPSWTEAHHIIPYAIGGRTAVRDGILLCRHHHMFAHNNGWQIVRAGDEYWLRPPRTHDPAQTLIRLISKNPMMHEFASRRQKEAS